MSVELREEIKIGGAEEAAAKLGRVAGAANKLASAFGSVTSIAATVGGVAGVWQLSETIRETDRLYAAVGRVKTMTGLAAGNVHAMFDWFEQSGLGMQDTEAIMTSLVRLSGKLGDGVAATAAQTQGTSQLMRRLGIAVKAGPEERLLQMAAAAQKGKLKVADLITAFGIPRAKAADMMSMLQQGPERLRQITRETLGAANVIDDRALASYEQMVAGRRQLAAAWGGLVGILYKNLVPAITVVITKITDGFKSIEPVVDRIGKILADYMQTVVTLTKTYLALLLAAKAVNAFSDPKNAMGVWDRSKQVGAAAWNAFTPTRVGRKFGPDGSVSTMFSVPVLGRTFAGSSGIVRLLSTFAGRLGVIGAVITIVIAAFVMLKNNVLGIRDMFVRTFGGILENFGSALRKVWAVLSKLFEVIKPIIAVLAGGLLIALLWIAKSIELLGWVIDKVMTAIVGIVNAVIWAINKIPGVDVDYIDLNRTKAKAKAEAGTRGAGSGNGTVVNQDFRGSRFEIQNNFPEGIDGGRVAVAFGDELARLGERRLDSGLRPIYSYR